MTRIFGAASAWRQSGCHSL